MDEGWFDRLAAVMGRLAAGDRSAMEDLYVGFGDPIRGAVRAELRRLGMYRVDPDDVEGLALDVVIDLTGRGGIVGPVVRSPSWDR